MTTNPLALNGLPAPLRFMINQISALDVLRLWYDDWLSVPARDTSQFLDFTLQKVGAEFLVANADALQDIPRQGALIIVANHPLGALEGMLLSRLLLQYRPDLKVLTNELLLKFNEFKDLFIGVDVLGNNSQQANARGIKQVSRHLAGGGALLIFPAGTVSVLDVGSWSIQDAPWNDIVGRLALKYKSACLPVHIEGRNSLGFYLSGLVHKRLRTLLLPRALLSQRHKRVIATIGAAIRLDECGLRSAAAATDYMRLSCELLSAKGHQYTPVRRKNSRIRSDISAEHLQQQFLRMQPYLITQRGDLQVYSAPFAALGCVAEQLGIVREHTFRQVGEGSGLALDQDRFDAHYWHILVWDKNSRKIAGAYRAAYVADVVKEKGARRLYSQSLFNYDQRFVDALGGAIEVGRSFVAADYQASSSVLDLLWRGIAAMVMKYPQCHSLFGCVSISNNFTPLIRALLTDSFLSAHAAEDHMRKLVSPVSPFSYKRKFWTQETLAALSGMTAINKLLGSAGSSVHVPVLIRHYLALNGKFIDFSVNPHFSDSLDGLILVDLRQAPSRYLRRYFGAQGAADFTHRWQNSQC